MITVKQNNLEKWRLAGHIAYEVIKKMREKIRAGAKIIEICEEAENLIRKFGAKPAFPVNISINQIAAHYTSPPRDPSTIPNNSIVKLDLGALLDNGEISDTAVTVGVNINKELRRLIEVTHETLYTAIENVRDGVRVGQLGKIIQETAHKNGYGVLVDLSGHSITNWNLHSGITIPNVYRRYTPKLHAGQIVAIEPFLVFSSKDSYTKPDYNQTYIFSIRNRIHVEKNKLLKILYQRFKRMPFTVRWIQKAREDPLFYRRLIDILYDLYFDGQINIYPALIEVNNKPVAQFEHTILVKRSSAEILTER